MDLENIKQIENLKQEKQTILDKFTQRLNANKRSMFGVAASFFKEFFSEKSFTITNKKGEMIATYGTATVKLSTIKEADNSEILMISMSETFGEISTISIDIESSDIPPYSNPRYSSKDEKERALLEIEGLTKEVDALKEKAQSGVSPTLSFVVLYAMGKNGTPISAPDSIKGQKFKSFENLLSNLFK